MASYNRTKIGFLADFENFGFAVLVLKLHTFCVFGEISISTPFTFMAAVPMRVDARNPSSIFYTRHLGLLE